MKVYAVLKDGIWVEEKRPELKNWHTEYIFEERSEKDGEDTVPGSNNDKES